MGRIRDGRDINVSILYQKDQKYFVRNSSFPKTGEKTISFRPLDWATNFDGAHIKHSWGDSSDLREDDTRFAINCDRKLALLS